MVDHYTLLLTDIVDSTALNARLGDAAMADVWSRHDQGSRDLLQAWRGREVDRSDGFLALFDAPGDAAGFAAAYHQLLARLPVPLRARAGLHCAALDLRHNAPADVERGAKPVDVVGLGKAVGARLMALAGGGQTLTSAATASLLETAGWRSVSHGHWRMKGLPEPLEVHEIGDEHTLFMPPTDAEKAQRVVWHSGQWISGEQLPHRLPAERDSFVGRREVLRTLGELLQADTRLVTLHGPGGIGKTRLALRYAWGWRGSFPGGVWFCDLAHARSVDGVLQAVASALSVPLGNDPVSQLGRAIAGREHCLVILDNFEQVARHAAPTLGCWLDAAPQARFVVTSRERLGLAGEHTLALQPLGNDEAVELFHQRAQAAQASYRRDDTPPAVAAQLVGLLDGLPLAVELAAPRIGVMSAAELLERMGDRFRLLATAGGRPDRQATLQNTLQWSWELMSEAERSGLSQLAVFEGGFDLAAADAVVDLAAQPAAPWVVDLLQALSDKSLLHRRPDGRFALLRMVQAFADERATAAQRTAAGTRHARHFAGLSESQAAAHGGIELDNLVHACRHAAATAQAGVAADCLVLAWAALRLTGPLRAALELVAELRRAVSLEGSDAAAVAWVEGAALNGLGHTAEARAVLAAALALHPEPADDVLGGRLHATLGDVLAVCGEAQAATVHLQTALAVARRLADTTLQCQAHNSMGALATESGDAATAQNHYLEALAVATRAADARWRGGVLGNLGTLHYGAGRLPEAATAYLQALELAREAGDRRWEGNALCNLGLIHHEQAQPDLAETALQQALALARQIGHVRLESTSMCNLGLVQAARGQWAAALHSLEAAAGIAEEIGDKHLRAACQVELERVRPLAAEAASAAGAAR